MIRGLIYCLPALGWGFMPIIARKVGGNPMEQLVGTTTAALFFGLTIHFLYEIHYTKIGIVVAFLSGVLWSFGQLFQFVALRKSEISKVMPVSNGTQLIFTTLSSGLILHEWQNKRQVIISLFVLLLLIFSIWLFTKSDKKKAIEPLALSVIMILMGSSLFLTGYVTLTSLFKVSGLAIFLPQSLGMFLSASLIAGLSHGQKRRQLIGLNLSTGLAWSVANVSLFYTIGHLGLGTSYTISQLCVFVSIFGGMWIFKEKKTNKEIVNISLAVILFLVSIYLLSIFK